MSMPTQKFILAIDQGTTSSRVLLLDQQGQVRAQLAKELGQSYPSPGAVEQDPWEIWMGVYELIKRVLNQANLSANEIAAIGITNQRETTVLWERATGRPVANAIVWQSRQSQEICRRWQHCYSDLVKQKTGLLIDPYFSASKIRWLLEQNPELEPRAQRGELCFGTIDSWLVWNLSGSAKIHVTDASNASRTLLYDIHRGQWDEMLCRELQIPMALLPTVVDSSGICAYSDPSLFGHAIAIAGLIGDQQASLFGHGAFGIGEAKNTYGTGLFLLMNCGQQRPITQKLLTTVAWQRGGQLTYALEGSVFSGGSLLEWLKNGLHLIDDVANCDQACAQVDSSLGVVVVPAFEGLGAPYWRSDVHATITGLTRAVTSNHLIRASLEAIAFQTYDVVAAMQKETGMELKSLRVDGGVTKGQFLLQFQSDLLACPVLRAPMVETTALGAAFMAGLAVRYWQDEAQLGQLLQQALVIRPDRSPGHQQRMQQLYRQWQQAVAQLLGV